MAKGGKRVLRAFESIGAMLRAFGLAFVALVAFPMCLPSRPDQPATPQGEARHAGLEADTRTGVHQLHGRAGVTLARDWMRDLTLGNVSTPMTWANGDRRWVNVTGDTMTGDLKVKDELMLTKDGTNAFASVSAAVDANFAYLTGPGWRILGNTTGTGLYFDTGNIVFGAAGAKVRGTSAELSFTGDVISTDGNDSFGVGGYLQSVGVATASLPTCNAGLKGAAETDTTLSALKFCDGTSWRRVLSTSNAAAQTAYLWQTGPDYLLNGTAVEGSNAVRLGTNTVSGTSYICTPDFNFWELTCYWETAGTGAGATVEAQISDGTTTRTVSLGLCTQAAFTTITGAPTGQTAALAANNINMQLTAATNCTANPANIRCKLSIACRL